MRCAEVDPKIRHWATVMLCGVVAETSIDDICAELVSTPDDGEKRERGMARFSQLVLSRWLGISADVFEPVFVKPDHRLHPSFLVADQIIVGDLLTHPPLASFASFGLGRVSKVLLLTAFLDAATRVVPELLAERSIDLRSDRHTQNPSAHRIALISCDCAPVSVFAHEQLHSVNAGLDLATNSPDADRWV